MPKTCRHLQRLLLAAFGAGLAFAAQPAAAKCAVASEDFASLQLSKSGLKDQAAVDALPASSQQMLCSTRALWKRVHSSGDHLPKSWPDDEPGFSPSYMAPDELRTFNKLEDEWIDGQMAADQARRPAKPGNGKAH